VPAVAAARPSRSPGVSRCTAVITAISAQGRPAPISTLPMTAARVQGAARSAAPAAKRTVPAAANPRSGSRRSRAPAAAPTATDPAPCAAYRTPAKAGERPGPASTTA